MNRAFINTAPASSPQPPPSRNAYTLTNEQLLLVNILNNMYNDNMRQLNSLTNTINRLNQSNDQIQEILINLLNPRVPPQNNRSRNNYRLDTIVEYSLPLNLSRQSQTADSSILENLLNHFLQPIDIYPTQSQIENATRRVRYSDIVRPVNTSCPITMEDFNDTDNVLMIRHCGHIFQYDSLIHWFRTNCRCPVCRFDIREYHAPTAPYRERRRRNENERTLSQYDISHNELSHHAGMRHYDVSHNEILPNEISSQHDMASYDSEIEEPLVTTNGSRQPRNRNRENMNRENRNRENRNH